VPKECQQSPESLEKSGFYLIPDPPKSPLTKGSRGWTKDRTPVPPLTNGGLGGSLGLIVKQ